MTCTQVNISTFWLCELIETVCNRCMEARGFHCSQPSDERIDYTGKKVDYLYSNNSTLLLAYSTSSDGVLNPSGVRFGSAEIYAVIESPPAPYNFSHAISDSLCIGQRRARDKDERVLLFLRMHKGHSLTEDLKRDIRTAIRLALSPRHVPSYIFEVNDIPVCLILIIRALRLPS